MHEATKLLMVKKDVLQSRNKLYFKILVEWNKLTVDETNPVKFFTQYRIDAFHKKFKAQPPQWRDDLLKSLDATGSTMVGLSSLYYEVTAAQYATRKKGRFARDGKYYCYANSKNVRSMVKGVVECLKYHFEPCVLEDAEGRLNVPLLCEMLPNIYRKRLYGKFGGLYRVKALNIMDEAITEQDMELLSMDEMGAKEKVHHPYTGELVETGELMYVVCDAKNLVYSDDNKHYSIPTKKIKHVIRDPGGGLDAMSLKDAAGIFMQTVTHRRLKNHAEGWFKWNIDG